MLDLYWSGWNMKQETNSYYTDMLADIMAAESWSVLRMLGTSSKVNLVPVYIQTVSLVRNGVTICPWGVFNGDMDQYKVSEEGPSPDSIHGTMKCSHNTNDILWAKVEWL